MMSDTEKKVELQGVANAAFTPAAGDDVTLNFKPDEKPAVNGGTVDTPRATEDQRYACGPFRPRCLESAGVRFFVFLTVLLCFVEGFAVNGIVSAALVHLEKQFGLNSTRSALISSSQDIGAMVVVLFVSFLGSRVNKARWVALGSLMMALGSLVFIVPHIATSATATSSGPPPTGLCELSSSHSSSSNGSAPSPNDDSGSGDSGLSRYLGVFMVGNIIHGLGFTPMFTMGTVYIDENAQHATAAVYIGLTYAAAGLGVAAGFFAGGQISEQYYVDFDKVDQSTLTFGPRDPQWIGAWWVGFIPACVCFVLLALPLYGFPKSLPSANKTEDKEVEANGKPETGNDDIKKDNGAKGEVFLFFNAIKRLICNAPFMLLSLGAAAETLIISGVTSFAFKYLAEQYNLTFDVVGNYIGGLILVGAVGMMGGGVLIRIFSLESVGSCRLLAGLSLVAALLGGSLLAGCAEVELAGKQIAYPGDTSLQNYTSGCQGPCQCSDVSFDPVCGSDNRVYFSPCHAGCIDMTEPGPMATYHNCSCVADAHNVSLGDAMAAAHKGRCSLACDNVYIFLPCLFLMFFVVLLTTTPNTMATIRSVDADIRPFALGFQWMILRLLGTIPGPPVVGYVLDRTCLVWSSGPDGTESCALYSKADMSMGIFIWWVVVNVVAMLCYVLASFVLAGQGKKSSSAAAAAELK